MSPVALSLNLILGLLLVGALSLGLRLEKRLRALREAHDGFAKAVSELDQAARRTEQGLAELKAAAEEARTALAERIDDARALSDRLSRQVAEVEAKADALAKRPLPAFLARRPDGAAAEPARTPAPRGTPPADRSRAAIDDELFEASRPVLAAVAGGRR